MKFQFVSDPPDIYDHVEATQIMLYCLNTRL